MFKVREHSTWNINQRFIGVVRTRFDDSHSDVGILAQSFSNDKSSRPTT